MRDAACRELVKLFGVRPFVFLTGDLGFAALEPLRDAMGERFINAGLAEQNMVSVAAGLASAGVDAWTYSIASFCYARPFEQIRNDVCQHDFPVKLVGNGGGYAYGPMGATHHALEDYGALLGLPNIHVFVPAFAADLGAVIPKLATFSHPAYLRLGRSELPRDGEAPGYAPWRKLLSGGGPLLVAIGPIAGALLGALARLELASRPEVWVVAELPLEANPVPEEFVDAVGRRRRLCVVEEHVAHGGLGQLLAHWLLTRGIAIEAFEHAHARGYPSGSYGSQAFHRRESGLDVDGVLRCLERLRA